MWSFIILPQRWIPIIPLDPLTVLCIHPEAVPNVVLASLSANMLWDTKESICLWYISLPMPRITAVVGNLRREGNVAELNPVHLLVSFSHSLSVIKTSPLLFFLFSSLYSVMLIDCFSSHLSQNPPCPRFDNWHRVCFSLYHHSGDTFTNISRNSLWSFFFFCKSIKEKSWMHLREVIMGSDIGGK